MPLKSYTVLQMKMINQPINTVGFWWLVLMGVGRDSLLIWGNFFTLQTLRSTNQPGTLTACVWKFFTAGNFFTKKFVPNFAAPWHGWEFEKGKFPPLLSWISAQLVILLWQGNCPQFCILYFHWCQPPNPGFLPPAPSCSKVPPWKMFANKHLQVCFIQL